MANIRNERSKQGLFVTFDKILIDTLAQAFNIGSMDQELWTVLGQDVERLLVDLHIGHGLPFVHGNDPLCSSLPAADINHQALLSYSLGDGL